MSAKKTIAIYVRVSSKHQANDGFSLEEQRRSLVADAERRGYDWEMFEDPGISGQTLDQRPAAVEMLRRIEAGEFMGVLAKFHDRLYRSDIAMAEMLIRLTQAGARIVVYGGNELDLTNPYDREQAWMGGIRSMTDQAQRTQRTTAGLRLAVEAEFWPGGPAPYGYRLIPDPEGSKHTKLAIDNEQAAVINRATWLILEEGHTTYSACRVLNAEGIRTERGSLWRHSNLRGHLRKPHLTGIWTYKPKDADEITMNIPAILDQETWDQLQGAIHGSPRPQRKHRVYPLTGRERNHLRCDCGGNYSGKTDTTKQLSVYVCSGSENEFGIERCPHTPRSVRRIDIEDAVLDQLRPIFTEDYLRQLAEVAVPDIDTSDYEAEIRNLTARINRRHDEKVRLARKLAEDDGLDFLAEAVSEIDAEIDDLHRQLRGLEHTRTLQAQRSTLEEQVASVSKQMATKLDDLDDESYARLADILQLDLERVGSNQFVGTASVPIPLDTGEICESGPPARALRPR